MKKIYIGALAFALISTGSFAQSSAETKTAKPEMKSELTTSVLKSAKGKQDYQKDLQVEIWSDDFSDPSTWDIAHDEATCSLDWEIGVGLTNQGDYPTGPIESTTAANGYAMLDSDYYGQTVSSSDAEDSWFTTASSIDLTDYDNVVLEFESLYRAFNNNSLYIVVSTNNTDWPDLYEGYDPSTNPNVWQVYENVDVNTSTANPVTTAINISEVAGGESTVWIRFNWTGTWGYSWFVDDVKINELPDNDMILDYGVISHNGTGDEYGRVPISQLYPQMYYAALSTNIGRLDQTDVVIDVVTVDSDNVEVMNISSDVEASVAPNAEFMFESDEDQSLDLGLYTTTFTVTSAEETDGDNFANNVVVRNFEITDNLYSLDGIGVHDVAMLSSLGTNSFIDAADGFMMMVYYDIAEDETELYGVEFLLTSTTVPGGSVFVHLLDTADVFAEVMDDPIVSSDEHIITQEDVDAGVVQLYFENSYSAPTDAYYAAVEMYSEDNEYDIRILDDVTVPQPSTSSMIFTPNSSPNTVFTNGNAAAIRLITMAPNSVKEIEKVAVLGQNVPNPASDRTTISFELLDNQEVSVRLTDMLGKVIIEENLGNLTPGTHQYTFELAGLQAGSYHYSIVSDKGSVSKAMQVIK